MPYKNKEYRKKWMEKWLKNHPGYTKQYYQNNKERKNKYFRNRRRTDINYRILCNLRRRLHHVIKEGLKSARTLELLGCSIIFLKQYLKKKFKKGMNWNNYGRDGWHIDHIVPCNNFNLVNLEEQKRCFNYTNLQPLWARENLINNAKLTRPFQPALHL